MCRGQIYKDKIKCLRFIVSYVSQKRYTFNNTNLYLGIFRPGPVTHCRPEPPCVVTDIPKRDIGLKTLLQQGISEPIFYGDLVYKFKRIVGKPNFSDQFKKIVKRYIWVG